VRFISEAARIKARDIDTRRNGTSASGHRAERNFDHLYGCENLKKETSSPSSFHHNFPGVTGETIYFIPMLYFITCNLIPSTAGFPLHILLPTKKSKNYN